MNQKSATFFKKKRFTITNHPEIIFSRENNILNSKSLFQQKKFHTYVITVIPYEIPPLHTPSCSKKYKN